MKQTVLELKTSQNMICEVRNFEKYVPSLMVCEEIENSVCMEIIKIQFQYGNS